jgi:hypothetical protein
VGEDVVIMLPRATEVIRISGDAASAIRAIEAGDTPVLHSAIVADLMERGVVVFKTGMSRRALITSGAIGVGAGIAVMAMPSVAAASSDSESPIEMLRQNNEVTSSFFEAYPRLPKSTITDTIVITSALVTLGDNPPVDAIPLGFEYFGIGEGVDGSDVVVFRFNPSLPEGTITRLEVRFTGENVLFWAVYSPA